jgi:predicted SAM-dependent methyltransferase
MAIRYYPISDDVMWNYEVSRLLPFYDGIGLDIGCGTRTISKDIYTLDIDPKVEPDILASGDNIPLPDESVDYINSIHSFEHFPDPVKTLKEWLRVLKKGGYIGIVHPDVDYTKKQKPPADNPGLRENPFNKHYHEHTQASFLSWLVKHKKLGFEIVDYGVACDKWSFYVILKKI